MRISSALSSPRFAILALGSLLVVGAGVWKLVGSNRMVSEPKSSLPPELSVARLKSVDAQKSSETIRRAMGRKDLTEEQRRQLMENSREAMEQRNQKRVEEYFACPGPEERKRIFDRHIDEVEKRRKHLEENRAKMTDEERKKEREKKRGVIGGGKNPAGSDRKACSKSATADQRAQQMAYRAAMQARMQERGIEPRR